MTEPKEDLKNADGNSDPGAGTGNDNPGAGTGNDNPGTGTGTDNPGTDPGTDPGNNGPGTGSDTGNNTTGAGDSDPGSGTSGDGDLSNPIDTGQAGQPSGDTGTPASESGTARRRNSSGSRKRNNRPSSDGTGDETEKDTSRLAQTLVVTQPEPGKEPRSAKLSKKAGKLAEDMDKVVTGAFHITSMFRGPHWKVKPEESKMIAEPMAEIMSELSPGFGKAIQKITMPLALAGALVTVMGPRIMLDLEVRNIERNKAAIADRSQSGVTTTASTSNQRASDSGPPPFNAPGGGDVTLVTQSIASLFNESN